MVVSSVVSRILQECLCTLAATSLAPIAVVVTESRGAPETQGPAEPTPETTTTPDVVEDERLVSATEMFAQGVASFETLDYLEAIRMWTQAYRTVEGLDTADTIQSALTFNIAEARMRQFKIDGQTTHLAQATALLERYRESLSDDDDEGQRQIREKLAEIAELEANVADAGVVVVPPEPTPSQDVSAHNPGATKIVIGAVLAGVGVGGFSMMGWGLAATSKQNAITEEGSGSSAAQVQTARDKGRTSTTVAWVGGIAGGVLLVSGATLLALGLTQNQRTSRRSIAAIPGRNGGAMLLWAERF